MSCRGRWFESGMIVIAVMIAAAAGDAQSSAARAARATAASAGVNVRMQNVVRQFVAQSGQQVIGLGSWISGRNYTATSDHDMRLVVSGGDPATALRQWQEARTRLRDLVRAEFGRDADRVLRTTNLYPPSQLMSGVENAADAVQRFRGLGQVPNLSATGVPRDAARFSEGLYGGGARVWTQGYERSAGRLFYGEGGRVFMGMTDLTHMSEGLGTFDVGGMANTSRQWMDHIDEAVRAGNGQQVAKYLDRLNRDLAKAKNLGRIEMDAALRTEMQSLSRALKANPEGVSALRGRIDAVLARGRQDATVLGAYSRSGPAGRAVLREVMADLAGQGRIRRILADAGNALSLDQALRAVTLYVELRRSTSYAAEEEFDRAYQSALAGAVGMANLPAGLAAELGAWALEAAKEQGFEFVASTQDAWDLMSGLYTAVGRTDLDEGRAYSLDDLVAKCDDEQALSTLVRAKAALASARELGDENARVDERVSEALYQRCWPVIRDAWLMEREKLAIEYEELCALMEKMPVLMSYTPSPIVVFGAAPVAVTVTARVAHPEFDRSRERLKTILARLCHTPNYVNLVWRWTGGEEGREPWIRNYRFTGSGRKPVAMTLEVRAGATGRWMNSPFSRTIVLPSGVDVLLESPPVPESASEPARTPPRDTAPTASREPVPATTGVTLIPGDNLVWKTLERAFYENGQPLAPPGPRNFEAVVDRVVNGERHQWRMDRLQFRFLVNGSDGGRGTGGSGTINFIPAVSNPGKRSFIKITLFGPPSTSVRIEMRDNSGLHPPVVLGPFRSSADQWGVEHNTEMTFPPAYRLAGGAARLEIRVIARCDLGGFDMVETYGLVSRD